MKKITPLIIIFACFTPLFAQMPAGYYHAANGKSGKELQRVLCSIIDGHHTVSYASLWQHFSQTDTKRDSVIWDIYSDNPHGSNSYDFLFVADQCGQVGAGEGHCYNREHTFCQSWFGGGSGAPYSDLFHIYPVDGYINSTRNNDPYGSVPVPQRVFSNGSKYGSNQAANAPSGNAFEPIDEYKGDIARSFFYMATRYMFEDENFLNPSPMTFRSQLQPWALDLFMSWHLSDPVSEKEQNRNNAIYNIQQNRNPFIDYPGLAGKIWGADSLYPFLLDDTTARHRPLLDGFEVKNPQLLQLHADMPLLASSVLNLENYAIRQGIGIEQVYYMEDTIYLHLNCALQNGRNYHLTVRNLQAENLYFLRDTSLQFMAGVPQHRDIAGLWSFDGLEGRPDVPLRIAADSSPRETAWLYLDGSHGSALFTSSPSQTQLDAFAGTLIGDPRGSQANASQSLAVVGQSANDQRMVFAIAIEETRHYSLTFACRRTSSGFTRHQWEWSLDGIDYQSIDQADTPPQAVAEFELRSLDIPTLPPLNGAGTLYLRLSLAGATSSTGNNRFDNITLYGEKAEGTTPCEPVSHALFSLRPNPSSNRMEITIHEANALPCSLRCLDLTGKTAHAAVLTNPSTEIDLSFLESGIYIILVESKNLTKRGAEKMVIQK